MAQYPQGIFQSLQYLLKKVKILALQKQPTYTGISTASVPYVIPGRGIYEIVDIGDFLFFPDPALCNGQTVIIITHFDSEAIQSIGDINRPLINGTDDVFIQLQGGNIYTFVSIDGKWRG